MIQELQGTIYQITPGVARGISSALERLSERVALLREHGTLTEETLYAYYGQKRFEQVAESNALEGSTLSVGETELAITKGITISGHDPAFVRDALTLNEALLRLVDMAREFKPLDIEQLHQLHALILGERAGAGLFRSVRVKIRGAEHSPPRTWNEIMFAMEQWQDWSLHSTAHPIIRASVLHAWLAHIHPYIDGNGRVGRAISNLELVRAGYPPIIIRHKERERYLDALANSDKGRLDDFIYLVLDRTEDSLNALVLAAGKHQGYNEKHAKQRQHLESETELWNARVALLFQTISFTIDRAWQDKPWRAVFRKYNWELEPQQYAEFLAGRSVSGTWCFRVELLSSEVRCDSFLMWIGARSPDLEKETGMGPALFWSKPNPDGYPPWLEAGNEAPGPRESVPLLENGSHWMIRDRGTLRQTSTEDLCDLIRLGFEKRLYRQST